MTMMTWVHTVADLGDDGLCDRFCLSWWNNET